MPLFSNIWQGMQKFQKQGKNVLNTNHTYNLERVSKEKFAYITDESSAAMLKAENGRIVTAPYKFMAQTYTVGVQRNSAHTKTMAKL